jgi:hypothetical protein
MFHSTGPVAAPAAPAPNVALAIAATATAIMSLRMLPPRLTPRGGCYTGSLCPSRNSMLAASIG